MKITTWLKYEVPDMPPRCRKPRYEEREEFAEISLRETSADKLTLAYEDRSYDGKGKIYRYAGKLWAKAKMPNLPKEDLERYGVKTPLDWLVYSNRHYTTYLSGLFCDKDTSRETVLSRAKSDMSKMLLVDGVLYERTSKPEYFILTFGLPGDGTGLFVKYPARRDCGWHFPATKGSEAVAKAREIAKKHGDNEHFEEYIICY